MLLFFTLSSLKDDHENCQFKANLGRYVLQWIFYQANSVTFTHLTLDAILSKVLTRSPEKKQHLGTLASMDLKESFFEEVKQWTILSESGAKMSYCGHNDHSRTLCPR